MNRDTVKKWLGVKEQRDELKTATKQERLSLLFTMFANEYALDFKLRIACSNLDCSKLSDREADEIFGYVRDWKKSLMAMIPKLEKRIAFEKQLKK